MLRINKYAALLAAGILILPVLTLKTNAESELIPEDQMSSDRVNYKTEDITYGEIQSQVVANGFNFISQSATYSYKGESVVYLETLVKTGDEVEEGDPIYRVKAVTDASVIAEKELNLQRLRENYSSDRSFLIQDRANLYNDLNGKEGLEAQKISLQIQRKNVEIEKLDYERTREIKKAEEELAELNDAVNNEYITAEASGAVSELHYYEEGEAIAPGDALYKITGEAQPMIVVNGNNFKYGMDVSLTGTFQGIHVDLKGKVVCANNVLQKAGLENAIISLEENAESKEVIRQMTSMANRISIIVASKTITLSGNNVDLEHVLLVPNDAIIDENKVDFVNILDDQNVLHKRKVKLAVKDNNYTWVIQGLEEGDRVVID